MRGETVTLYLKTPKRKLWFFRNTEHEEIWDFEGLMSQKMRSFFFFFIYNFTL